MATQWSKRALVLVVMACAAGGFLAGSSWSQAPAAPREEREIPHVGRYQMSYGAGVYVITDTSSGDFWVMVGNEREDPTNNTWRKIQSPARLAQ
jgi:hypothetical protein